jgi:hypothetical protein
MKKILSLILVSIIFLTGCTTTVSGSTIKETIDDLIGNETTTEIENNNDYSNNQLITVDDCNQSGSREPNVKVDVGYGTREYYAYTNEYSQLVYVEADEIILQDDDTEKVNSDGRYCNDEAKVPGVESSTLDEGHAVADSLGGVSNAYNITPQNSTVNRSGSQSEMEEYIRNAEQSGHQITEFEYTITYPDTTTQIPSTYKVEFKDNGEVVSYSFENK